MRVTYPIAVALALTIASQPAMAQSGNGATISRDGECGGAVPTPDGDIGETILTGQLVSVTNAAGNAVLTCHFDIPADLVPTTTTRAVGFRCGVPGAATYDSRMTATPGGKATLVCRINKKSVTI